MILTINHFSGIFRNYFILKNLDLFSRILEHSIIVRKFVEKLEFLFPVNICIELYAYPLETCVKSK